MKRGSWIAGLIEADMRREEYWKNKVVRQKCYIDNVKQCDKCMYKRICEDTDIEDEEAQ